MDKDKLEALLQIALAAVAKECGKKQDDLSVGLYRTLKRFAIECFEAGVDDAYERPTKITPRPFPAVDDKAILSPKDPRREFAPRTPTRRATPPPPPPYPRAPSKTRK